MDPERGFIFGTWNAGSQTADYTQLIRDKADSTAASPNLNELLESPLMNSINQVRDKLLKENAIELSHAADVLALQEVSGNERADIQEFMRAGFQIIRPPKKAEFATETDTAIAINPQKFDEIEDRSFVDSTGHDFAIAVAVERESKKKIAFISGHIAGFNLEETDVNALKADAASGDQAIENLIETIKEKCKDCETVLIGTDVNAIPEKYQDRFNLFTEAGFQLYRTNTATSNMSRTFSGHTASLQERELDYIFLKKPTNRLLSFLKKLFGNEKVHVAKIITDRTNFSLDPISISSDHLPIMVKVDSVVQRGVFSRFFSSIGSLAGRLKNLIK